MTAAEFMKRLGFRSPDNPIDRDAHLLSQLAERMKQSDAEIRELAKRQNVETRGNSSTAKIAISRQ